MDKESAEIGLNWPNKTIEFINPKSPILILSFRGACAEILNENKKGWISIDPSDIFYEYV